MKKINQIITISMMCIGGFSTIVTTTNANAELQPRLNSQAVYDTDLDITWLANTNAGGRLNFSAAQQWVSNLSVDGVTGWRLPDAKTTFNGTSYSLSEMGHLFYNELGGNTLQYPYSIFDSTDPDLALFSNISGIYHWTLDSGNGQSVAYNFGRGFQAQTYRVSRRYGVWAVHDGDVGSGAPACIVDCLRVNNFTLSNTITTVQSTIKLMDENGSAASTRNAVVHIQWTRPDGTKVDQNAFVGTSLRVNFSLPITETGIYALAIQDVIKTGYSYDSNNSVAISKNITVLPQPNSATIGDRVWEDTNGNGYFDTSENGAANITVNLLPCYSSNILQSTTTDQLGNYSFSNLASGGYQVQFDLPTAYHFSPQYSGIDPLRDSNANTTTGKTHCSYLNNGDTKVDYDAGLIPNSSDPEPVLDNVTVLKAIYKHRRNRLIIKAHTDAMPRGSAVITAFMVKNGVETELGTLRWKARRGLYKKRFYILSAPDSIVLRSNQGGEAIKNVKVR